MIETERLKLLPCELAHYEALLGDPQRLARMLGVSIIEGWAAFPESIPYSQKYLLAHPDALPWWMHLFLHTNDRALVGYGGYKGKADADGMVEIGYSIAPAYRHRGLATEAARGLIDFAFSHPHIKMVDAHTLAEENDSTRVLKRVGMTFVGQVNDPEDGDIWHWRLPREDYARLKPDL
jgi:ribosomal-protein-alanine N-acetyltransferase